MAEIHSEKQNINDDIEIENLENNTSKKKVYKKNYKAKFCEICQKDYKDFYQHRKIKHSEKQNNTNNLKSVDLSETSENIITINEKDILKKIDIAINNLNEIAELIKLKLNSL